MEAVDEKPSESSLWLIGHLHSIMQNAIPDGEAGGHAWSRLLLHDALTYCSRIVMHILMHITWHAVVGRSSCS